MKLHLIVNMKVNGLELLKMLSLVLKYLIEIEFLISLNMKLPAVQAKQHTIYLPPTLDVKDAILLFVYLKLLLNHKALLLRV